MLKILTSLCMLGAINFVYADDADGVWADGYVSYTHPDGNIVTRDCSLWVPARGQGDVTLKCGDWSTSSKNFYVDKNFGKTNFSVIFDNMDGAPEGMMAWYTGSYLRGKNQALYYGDVFTSTMDTTTYQSSEWSYVGGFMFNKSIDE